jgi:hypothetical protein
MKISGTGWDSMRTWDLVLPPSRPSATELDRIRSVIRTLDHSCPVAILGSTPEFRDLLHECGFTRIFVLDKNRTFFTSMSEARVFDNEESVIEGDWLTTLLSFKKFFGLILSDLTSGNLDYECRPHFYHLIEEALSANGMFFDKVLTHPLPHISLSLIGEQYSSLPLNLCSVNRFSCEALFCSELLDIENRVDSSLFYSLLNERFKTPRLRSFVKSAEYITPPGFVWWYGKNWEELSISYCPQLKLLSKYEDDLASPYFGRLKVFVHRKE